jgi:2-polyprenyl-6-methoxyphenol hydroxylase-like FAD-dependent oxidoreductase
MHTSRDSHHRSADVVVVGAGPAGAMTALLLARRGIPVTLLDRARFPRPKPCGDCLSAAATGLLRRLGLLDRVLDAGAASIGHWRIVALDGTSATGGFGETPALALERRRLDPVLLDAAIEAGAHFRTAQVTDILVRDDRVRGVAVRDGASDRSTVEAALVVGADGLRSTVARRLDLVRRKPTLRKVSLTAHLLARGDHLEHGEMHLIPSGCLGYAPAGDGLINLTLVITTAAAADLREMGPAAFFREQVRHAPALDGALIEALDGLSDDDLLASGPFDLAVRTPVSRGAALVGDAAGYYDPFTGQGIYQAMAAAEQLVLAVGPTLESGRIDRAALDLGLRRYARAKRRLTNPARRVQRGIEWVLSRPRLANRILARLATAPVAMDRLVAVTGALRRPASLLSPAVVSSFMIPRSGGPIDPHR